MTDSSLIQSFNPFEPELGSLSRSEVNIIEQLTTSLDATETLNSNEHDVDHELSEGTMNSEVGISLTKTSVRDLDYNDYGKSSSKSLSFSSLIQHSNITYPRQDDLATGPAKFKFCSMEESGKGKSKSKDTFEDEYPLEEDCNEDFHTFDIRAFFLKAFQASIDHATDGSTTSDDYEGAISDSETPQDHVDLDHGSLGSCLSTPGPCLSSVMDVTEGTRVISPDYNVCKSLKRKASFIEGLSRITLDDIRRRERMLALNSYEWQRFL